MVIEKRRKIRNFSPPPTFAQKTSGPQQLPVNKNLRFRVPDQACLHQYTNIQTPERKETFLDLFFASKYDHLNCFH